LRTRLDKIANSVSALRRGSANTVMLEGCRKTLPRFQPQISANIGVSLEFNTCFNTILY